MERVVSFNLSRLWFPSNTTFVSWEWVWGYSWCSAYKCQSSFPSRPSWALPQILRPWPEKHIQRNALVRSCANTQESRIRSRGIGLTLLSEFIDVKPSSLSWPWMSTWVNNWTNFKQTKTIYLRNANPERLNQLHLFQWSSQSRPKNTPLISSQHLRWYFSFTFHIFFTVLISSSSAFSSSSFFSASSNHHHHHPNFCLFISMSIEIIGMP